MKCNGKGHGRRLKLLATYNAEDFDLSVHKKWSVLTKKTKAGPVEILIR